eukprot:jgi/Galph1/5748/GphlegSOOS_G4309.1
MQRFLLFGYLLLALVAVTSASRGHEAKLKFLESRLADAFEKKQFIITVSANPDEGADFGPHTPYTNTSGIQEALDYAASFLTNENMNPTSRKSLESNAPIVFLGPGRFYINQTIYLPEYGGFTLRGSGPHSTILFDATQSGITILKQKIPKNVGYYWGQLNEIFTDFGVLGNPYNTSVAGIDLSMPENIPHNVVSRIALYGNFTNFHLCMDGNEDSLLDTIFVDGYSDHGKKHAVIGFSTGGGATFIRGLYFSNPIGGARIHARSINLYITDGVIGAISNTPVTKGQYLFDPPASVILIKNCWFNIDEGLGDYVFDLHYPTNYSIIELDGVDFYNPPAGHYYFSVGKDVNIERLQLQNVVVGYGKSKMLENKGNIASVKVGYVFSDYPIEASFLRWYPSILSQYYVATPGIYPIIPPPPPPPMPSPPALPSSPAGP